ncbi:unnamed protein product [Gadus morhua 'NCC']
MQNSPSLSYESEEEGNLEKWWTNFGILKEREPELEGEPDPLLITAQLKHMDSPTHLCFEQLTQEITCWLCSSSGAFLECKPTLRQGSFQKIWKI